MQWDVFFQTFCCWYGNIGSGNGLELSGKKQWSELMLTKILDIIWYHQAVMSNTLGACFTNKV